MIRFDWRRSEKDYAITIEHYQHRCQQLRTVGCVLPRWTRVFVEQHCRRGRPLTCHCLLRSRWRHATGSLDLWVHGFRHRRGSRRSLIHHPRTSRLLMRRRGFGDAARTSSRRASFGSQCRCLGVAIQATLPIRMDTFGRWYGFRLDMAGSMVASRANAIQNDRPCPIIGKAASARPGVGTKIALLTETE